MDLVINEELATILRPYQQKGWAFRYSRSINPHFKKMVVLYYTIPNQPPRFERFDPQDPQMLEKVSVLLAGAQILSHQSQRPTAAATVRGR
jgi:hypothetical protein